MKKVASVRAPLPLISAGPWLAKAKERTANAERADARRHGTMVTRRFEKPAAALASLLIVSLILPTVSWSFPEHQGQNRRVRKTNSSRSTKAKKPRLSKKAHRIQKLRGEFKKTFGVEPSEKKQPTRQAKRIAEALVASPPAGELSRIEEALSQEQQAQKDRKAYSGYTVREYRAAERGLQRDLPKPLEMKKLKVGDQIGLFNPALWDQLPPKARASAVGMEIGKTGKLTDPPRQASARAELRVAEDGSGRGCRN
jgi:hypothetical protein